MDDSALIIPSVIWTNLSFDLKGVVTVDVHPIFSLIAQKKFVSMKENVMTKMKASSSRPSSHSQHARHGLRSLGQVTYFSSFISLSPFPLEIAQTNHNEF